LYIPPAQNGGRIDNPATYRVLYVADQPEAAVGEAFAAFSMWSDPMFYGPPSAPGSLRRLAEFEIDPGRCLDLDDGATLAARGIRPSEVVTRQRRITRGWASRIYSEGKHSGVSWWSYHNPEWTVRGLWDTSGVAPIGVEDLERGHPAVQKAREFLRRPWKE
jgi:hypothetical protein